jgi:O-acetylhomoserine (thiol)-lyase
MRAETIAVHGGYDGDPNTRAVAVPIYQTAAYTFDDAEHAMRLFDLDPTVPGYRYSRLSNPTVDVLDRRLALLEGGVGALSLASGQAAMFYAMLNLCEANSNFVTVPTLYGTTYTLFQYLLPSLKVFPRFAKSDSAEDVAAMIDDTTRAVYCESVGNPAGNIVDIAALADIAHQYALPLVVDNTVATPILLRPIEHGADIVVHSLTKYLGGHGTTIGGAIVDSGNFDWTTQDAQVMFPQFSKPDPSHHGLVYTEHFGRSAYIARARTYYQRMGGAVMTPMAAWQFLQGIETVGVRLDRHIDNGRKVAEYLAKDQRVAWVSYVGFPDNPHFKLCQQYLGGRAAALLTFGPLGGREAALKFHDSLKLIKRLVNIGDAKSLVCHPASTTHHELSEKEQLAAGVRPEMIRLSIGIEHIDDILEDIDQALDAATSDIMVTNRFFEETRDSGAAYADAVFGEGDDETVDQRDRDPGI